MFAGIFFWSVMMSPIFYFGFIPAASWSKKKKNVEEKVDGEKSRFVCFSVSEQKKGKILPFAFLHDVGKMAFWFVNDICTKVWKVAFNIYLQ